MPFEMVDAALSEAGSVQSRVRDLPSRVVVYLLLAGALFAERGYGQVWARMTAGLGTRTIIDATFGSIHIGEISYAPALAGGLRRGMIVLGDRNFAATALITAIADTGADMLIRTKSGRRFPVCRRLADGSYLSRIGPVEVRVIRAEITIATSAGHRSEVYRLVTTVVDTDHTAAEIVALYHQRWEIETAFLELKQTILGGRVLRARTPAGIDQEIYALLVTYQALRIAITDATLGQRHVDPDRGSFTIALNAARDQIIAAAGVIADTVIDTVIDLVGVIGRHVRDNLMPARRLRTSPRVVKRAISNYTVKTATGRVRGPSRTIAINIDILAAENP